MEEEKKDNKGLKIGVIIFLIICLGGILFFMYKMTYVGDKTREETDTADTPDESQVVFSELTTIEIKEGEEITQTIGGKEITFKVENGKYYLNKKELGETKGTRKIYYTNNLIFIPYMAGQSGNKFNVYNLDLEKVSVDDKGGADAQYLDIRIKDNRLFVDIGSFGDCTDPNTACYFFDRIDTECLNESNKNITEYPEELEKHKNDALSTTTYEIKYENNQVTIEKVEEIDTLAKWIETFDTVCLRAE